MKTIDPSKVRLVLVPFLRFLVEKDQLVRHQNHFIFKNAIKNLSHDEVESVREAIAKSVYKSFYNDSLVVDGAEVSVHSTAAVADDARQKIIIDLQHEVDEHKDYIKKLSVESQKLNRENEDLRQEILALKAQKTAADSSGSGGKAQPAVDPLGVFNP